MEVVWISLIVLFGLIGLVRGFLKEIGVTTVMVFLLFILGFFKKQVEQGLDILVALVHISPAGGPEANLLRLGVYVVTIGIFAFISYAGETLAFQGRPIPGPLGIALNLLAGLLNGYLLVGSIWYCMHLIDYPISVFGLFEKPLSAAAAVMVTALPGALIPPFGFLAIAGFLILMRVVK